MAILVTRPEPGNAATARALRARGHDVLLSPMLQFEPVAFRDDGDNDYDAVILTSANTVRALSEDPDGQAAWMRWRALPVYAVGDRTAEAARGAGFATVFSAQGDADALRDLLMQQVADGKLKAGARLCYPAAANISRDIAADFGVHGFTVVTHTAYRMAPLAELSADVGRALRLAGVEAVLHYSRRSAQAFVAAARGAGVEVSALAVPQYCISEVVGAVLREAGAARVTVAHAPDEDAMFAALARAVTPVSRLRRSSGLPA
jgi:uroporphyrinogen-III synthase